MRLVHLASAVVAVVLSWAAPAFAQQVAPAAWITTADGAERLTPYQAGVWGAAAADVLSLHVDPTVTYQEIHGFGASITDASAWLIQRKLNRNQRAALLQDLFGRDGGIGLSATRLTIGASDFSRTHYSYSSGPGRFSLSAARRDVVPATLAARAINPELYVFASPWSAPAWMKTNGSLVTGSLAREHYGDFAAYLSDYVRGMGALGVRIDALTVQNEPHFEPGDYPGMRMSPAERAVFVGEHLGPTLERENQNVALFDWDHNWDQPDSPLAFLAVPTAARYVSGVAWHCYGGEVSAQSRVHDAFPDKSTWMTECSGGAWASDWGETLDWMTRNLIIGTTRNWAEGVILWNLALDETSGPHLGGCGNCRGVVTINRRTGEVTRNVEYYVLGHASRFVRPGARRIASDSGVEGLESVAFRNGDGSIAVLVLNGAEASRRFQVVIAERAFSVSLPAGAVATFVWAGGP